MNKKTAEDMIFKDVRKHEALNNKPLQSVLKRLIDGVKELDFERIAWRGKNG